MTKNRQVLLASRRTARMQQNWARQSDIPTPGEGQMLLRDLSLA